MESTGGSSGSTMTAAAAMPSPSVVADSSRVFCSSLFKATNYEFDPSIKEEERRFYLKAYPTVDVVRERKTHCTVCKVHIGTAPVQEHGIKMHPILRVTHCNKCHDFYNSGEFSKGEDGSELYCRWCGQGGEVYCCSSCPYVFCKSCIVKNLSRGVVADIEQNENWNCFSCAPKILWPLRAQHWALMNYIEQQKKEIYALNLSEAELKTNLSKDRSRCCRLAKSKCGNMSDSMESLDSLASKRSHGSATKKPIKHSATPSPQQINAAKRAKTNDEVVCTPDLLSMLEPDCQITVSPKPNRPMTTPSASTPKIMSIQQPQAGYGSMSSTPKSSAPPPLVLRNTAIKLRPAAPPPVVRRTIIGPRTPNPGGNGTPVYHTINGYRIDLNSAAQQETFRLPNGKLIQVKRQGPPTPQNASPSANNWQRMSSPQPQRVIPQTIASRPVQITQHPYNISVQHHPQVLRYNSSMIGSTTINPVNHNGTTIQVLNGQITSQSQPQPQQQQQVQQSGPVRPVMVRHVFPDNPIGQARNGLQDQVFNAMEICTHLTNKVQTLTNSNAYKQARNFLEVKELYIHLSYLLTYAIGRFKSLQDKCLGDMRTLGFGNDADCLENGQLAADKQASDDEDNEIEIVEPKTDLITLDSDDDEPPTSTPIKTQHPIAQIKTQQKAYSSPQHSVDVKIKPRLSPASIALASRPVVAKSSGSLTTTHQGDDNMDLMSMAQSFLASMLEVDIHEGPLNSPGSDSSAQKKQPRKKLTNKPNPTLLKQKALMELERLEEMKRNDQKLKMKCAVELKKAEEVFPYAKEMLEAKAKEKQEYEEAKSNKLQQKDKKLTDETEKITVEVIMDDDAINSSTEETNKTENNDTIKTNTTSIEKEEATEGSVEITDKNNDKTEDDDENNAQKETSMKTSEKEKCEEITHEIQDKSTENIAESAIPTETTEKETSVEIQNEIKDKSTENIAENDIFTETTEKEAPVEILDNSEDKSTEDILHKVDEEPQDKDAEVKSNDHADDDDTNENKNKIETDAISETNENSKNDDTEENKANGVTNEDKIQEDMEIDEKPPGTPTLDESMDNDEDMKAEESPLTSLTADDMETNNTKPDEKLDIDEDKEKVSPPPEDQNIHKENENVVPQKEANDEDENMNESVQIGNQNQLSSPTKETLTILKNREVEEPSTKPTTTTTSTDIESDKVKDTVKVLAHTEETIKTSPSAAEDIPSKKQTNETPATEIEATTTSSNGNI